MHFAYFLNQNHILCAVRSQNFLLSIIWWYNAFLNLIWWYNAFLNYTNCVRVINNKRTLSPECITPLVLKQNFSKTIFVLVTDELINAKCWNKMGGCISPLLLIKKVHKMIDERSSSSILWKKISEPQTEIQPATFWWPVRASHQSSEGCRFDPRLGLRNHFSEDRAWRTFIYHLKISPSSHPSKIFLRKFMSVHLWIFAHVALFWKKLDTIAPKMASVLCNSWAFLHMAVTTDLWF